MAISNVNMDVPDSALRPYFRARDTNALGSNFNAPDTSFSLTDAAEEMSYFTGARLNESKSMSERGIGRYVSPQVARIHNIESMLKDMNDPKAAAEVAKFAEALLQTLGRREDVVTTSRRWSGDPTKQYMALAKALELAQARSVDPRIREALRDAAQRMLANEGPAIYAGFNTIEQASAFGATAADADRFRATYRDAVLGQATFSDTLMLVLERFGEELERGVELLRKALAADLASLTPSRDPARLNAILQDLYQLAVAVSVLQRCRVIADQLRRAFAERLHKVGALALMKDIVKWTAEPMIMGYHVTLLLQEYELHSREEEHRQDDQSDREGQQGGQDDEGDDGDDEEEPAVIVFLNGVADVLRGLPVKVFASDESRLQAVAAVQQAMDAILLQENQ
jgi:type III secretion protein W